MILNFVVEDSIEERVLQRLLTKIEIFRESIGEPDPIIGEEIERLAGRALQGDLTPEELDREIEREGQSLALRVLEAKNMLTRVDGLLAADQALIDEINAMIGERQLPSENELLLFLNSFLATRFPGSQLPSRTKKDVVSVNLGSSLGIALENASMQLGHDAAIFGRKVSTGPVELTLSREAGYRHGRAEVLHLQHPLTRFAVSETNRGNDRANSAFALNLETKLLPRSRYGFLVSLIHVRTQRSLTKLVAIFTDWETGQMWTDPDQNTAVLIELLDNGLDVERTEPFYEIEAVKNRLLSALDTLKASWEQREAKLEQARMEQQAASRQAILEFRVSRIRDRLAKMQSANANEFAVRMTAAQLARAEQALKEFLSTNQTASWGIIEHQEIAVGQLTVT